MSLYVRNRLIKDPLINILKQVQSELTNGKLKQIRPGTNYIQITCPIHKDGQEQHPSCVVSTEEQLDRYGVCKCFTCGYTANFITLISDCFEISYSKAETWIIEHTSSYFVENDFDLPEITFENQTTKYLDENILQQYNYYHPYMYQRQLTKPVIDKFHIGYDKENDCITFPVWDEQGHLVTITKRAIHTKKFYLEKDIQKPVYLLNFIKQEGLDNIYVTESQINALTLWSWGFPAIALFGTGSSHQYEILKKSGITHYILCFDGDEAGDKGIKNFISNLSDSALITIIHVPRGKDINDLNKKDFCNLNFS